MSSVTRIDIPEVSRSERVQKVNGVSNFAIVKSFQTKLSLLSPVSNLIIPIMWNSPLGQCCISTASNCVVAKEPLLISSFMHKNFLCP